MMRNLNWLYVSVGLAGVCAFIASVILNYPRDGWTSQPALVFGITHSVLIVIAAIEGLGRRQKASATVEDAPSYDAQEISAA